MEKDKEDAKEKAMQGKEVTRGEQIVKKGETVDQFIQRVWKWNWWDNQATDDLYIYRV